MRDACVTHARQFTWDRCADLTYREAPGTRPEPHAYRYRQLALLPG